MIRAKQRRSVLALGILLIAGALSVGAAGQVNAQVDMDEWSIPEVPARPLGEFTCWLYDRLIQSVDPTLQLPPEASDRAEQFWMYMWDGLDPDSRSMIDQIDLYWPAARTNWEASGPEERLQINAYIVSLVDGIWGDQVVATASFLAGEISYDEYVPYMDALYTSWVGGIETEEYPQDDTSQPETREDSEWTIHDVVSTHLGNFIEY
jgi:hypothetical protein